MNRKVGAKQELPKLPKKGDEETAMVKRCDLSLLPPYKIDPTSTEGMKPTEVKGDVEFKNVGFTYPARRNKKVRIDWIIIAMEILFCGIVSFQNFSYLRHIFFIRS